MAVLSASPRKARGSTGSSIMDRSPFARPLFDPTSDAYQGRDASLTGCSTMTETMTAIAIEGGKGAADALHPQVVDRPEPGPGQVLIKVEAAGVNRPDLLQRLGFYPPPPGAPTTLGLEVAGEIVVLGEGGEGRWKAGDKVCALLGGGGYAEYAVVDARHALPIPEGLDLIHAAALPETVFTVFANVFEHGGLKAGETLLVHGGTSGIGTTAIAMAKAAGAKVI